MIDSHQELMLLRQVRFLTARQGAVLQIINERLTRAHIWAGCVSLITASE